MDCTERHRCWNGRVTVGAFSLRRQTRSEGRWGNDELTRSVASAEIRPPLACSASLRFVI